MSESDPPGGGVTASVPPPETRPPKVRQRPGIALVDGSILRRALVEAFVKLDPRHMGRNPVMFVVEVGSLVTTIAFLAGPSLFVGSITVWLWATVLFANFAEAVAEGRGKAQADALRRTRQDTVAFVLQPDGTTLGTPPSQLQLGDLCVVEAGQIIPGDGDVIEGIATVDESAITGESAPVIRESGGDRSAVTGGTIVLSDRIVVRITSNPGATFLDRMISLVEGASRQKTPNEIALDILISGLTLILLVAVVTLQPMAIYSKAIQSTTAFWFAGGAGWLVEGHGVDPDIDVLIAPHDWAAGRDPQLETAIASVLASLEQQGPAQPPSVNDRPSRALPALPPRPDTAPGRR